MNSVILKKWRPAMVVLTVLAIALGLAACGNSDNDTASKSDSTAMNMDSGGTGPTGMKMDSGGSDGPQQMMPQMKKLASVDQDGMNIEAVVMPPTRFTAYEGGKFVEHTPTGKDNAHLMVVLSDAKTGETIPYSSISARITGPGDRVVYDGTLWPMLSRSMGMHYGDLLAFPKPGEYQASLVIGVPQVGRHPEYEHKWLKPMSIQETLDWSGKA